MSMYSPSAGSCRRVHGTRPSALGLSTKAHCAQSVECRDPTNAGPLQGESIATAPRRLVRLVQSMETVPGLTGARIHAILPVVCGAVPQATLCLRSCHAPPMSQEEPQIVALWVGACEAWQRPARAALKGMEQEL